MNENKTLHAMRWRNLMIGIVYFGMPRHVAVASEALATNGALMILFDFPG